MSEAFQISVTGDLYERLRAHCDRINASRRLDKPLSIRTVVDAVINKALDDEDENSKQPG